MIAKFFAQALIVVGVVEMVPVDMSQYEYRAELPVAEVRSSSYDGFSLASFTSSLPTNDSQGPERIDEDSLGIVTSASSALVVDAETLTSLFEKQSDMMRPVGSITKLLSVLVFLETNPDLNQSAILSWDDYREGGRLYLAMNDEITLGEVLEASLIGSDNSATVALMRYAGMDESEFVARMNELAKEIGMHESYFVEPTGLSAHNLSTARDIVLLLDYALKNEIVASISSIPGTTITQSSGREIAISSTNTLLESFINKNPYTIVGGKTGYLPEAGYCIGLEISHNGNSVYIVLLGSDTKTLREQEVKGVTTWTFDHFVWR